MDFSEALQHLKSGARVTRTGWNGRGMFMVHHHPPRAPRTPTARETAVGQRAPYAWR